LIQIGLKTAEKNSAQTNRQTDRHHENNGHLAVNQLRTLTTILNKYHAFKHISDGLLCCYLLQVPHLPGLLFYTQSTSVLFSDSESLWITIVELLQARCNSCYQQKKT